MELQAKDLRIGNWIFKDKHFQINGVNIGRAYNYIIDNDRDEYEIENIKPIPLTEEWLLKFGFERDVSDLIIEINNHSELSFDEDLDCYLSIDNGHEWNSTDINIKYVHQLQNLYFALTGEELTIKN